MKWKVFYGDSSTFSDLDGTPYEAPARNVQAIVYTDSAVGWYVHHAEDYYWWDEALGWVSGDKFGLYDYLIEPGPKRVLFGRSIAKAEYQAILERARSDPDLPPKSAYLPNERQP